MLGETSYHAAATSLGIERSSIGPLRHRALRKLRDLFEDVSTRPPVVFLPAEQPRHARATTADLKLWFLPDNRLALPVYTSQDTLTAALGKQHAWVAVKTAKLNEILSGIPADHLLWDPEPPTGSSSDEDAQPTLRTRTVTTRLAGANLSGGRRRSRHTAPVT